MHRNKIISILLIASLSISAASCSSKTEESTASSETTTASAVSETATETSKETTATSETTTEETTSSDETDTEETEATTFTPPEASPDDPDLAEYTCDDVRDYARYYMDQGEYVEYMRPEDAESFWGVEYNIIEGFAHMNDNDNLFSMDFVIKFTDKEAADEFLNNLDASDYGPVVVTDMGSYESIDIGNGYGYATLNSDNLLVMELGDDIYG